MHASADRGIATSGVDAVDVQSRLMPSSSRTRDNQQLVERQGTKSSTAWYVVLPAYL